MMDTLALQFALWHMLEKDELRPIVLLLLGTDKAAYSQTYLKLEVSGVRMQISAAEPAARHPNHRDVAWERREKVALEHPDKFVVVVQVKHRETAQAFAGILEFDCSEEMQGFLSQMHRNRVAHADLLIQNLNRA